MVAFFVFLPVIVLIHLPYLDLPFFWDELGQFVPAALDLFRDGRWVPRSTTPNVHPPGLMAYLAAVWRLVGYSVTTSRAAMLLLSAGCALLTFLLAGRLCRADHRAPAWWAAALLVASPLFYTQAMMAQLDMPATLFTLWALLWFLQGRYRAAALISVALTLTKETGAVAQLVFLAWLWREGKRREACWFALPLLALAGWLAFLADSAGNVFGNAEFAEYNIAYPLHPARLALALARRVLYLFLQNFHWIGWVAVGAAWRRARLYEDRAWKIAGTFALAHVLAVTVLGGATLERYLLPALPLMYIAMAAAWSSLPACWSRFAQPAMLAGLVASLFWHPLWPAPFENNLAMTDFVRLHRAAAEFLERNYAGSKIITAWPLSSALRRPEFGYVRRALDVSDICDFTLPSLAATAPQPGDVLVLYTRDWDPAGLYDRFPALLTLRSRLYGYQPPASPEQLAHWFRLRPVAEWRRGAQWVIVCETLPAAG